MQLTCKVGRRINHINGDDFPPITGGLLKAKAADYASSLHIEGFMATNGWLGSWKGRYNVKQFKRCGEGADVDEEVVDNYKTRIPNIVSGKNKQRYLIAMKLGYFIEQCQTKTWQKREMQLKVERWQRRG